MFHKKLIILTQFFCKENNQWQWLLICYDLKDVVTPFLRSISHNDYNSLSPLQIPMIEHDNMGDENNRREGIEFDRSVSIGMQ